MTSPIARLPRNSLLTLLTLMVIHFAEAQTNQPAASTGFEFLPEGLDFAPLKANAQEARVGVLKYFSTSNLKVDIGNTIDVFGWRNSNDAMRFTLGIDFMAYAFVTGSQGLRLQVDAIDGFFGGHLSATKYLEDSRLQARLRILHLSAHMLDGHYELATKRWIDDREPIPFTKDFGELVVAHDVNPDFGVFKYYGGISYATLGRPTQIERFGFLAGFELGTVDIIGSVLDKPTIPFVAVHATLSGNPVYTGNINTQVGVKFGDWDRKGIVLYLAYYNGNNFFSEYFDQRVTIWGTGFTVDFP